jgi:hypothetical protein
MYRFLTTRPFVTLKIINHSRRLSLATATIILLLSLSAIINTQPTFGTLDFVLRATQQVYLTGDILTVYGAATANEVLVVRVYDPSGLAIRIEYVQVDDKGFFRQGIMEWLEPSKNLPFGTYTVEAISSIRNSPLQVEVSFAEGVASEAPVTQFPRTHTLGVKLDSPVQVTVNSEFRIFVQVTYDNALVDAKDETGVIEILGSSHIHSGNSTINLNDKFKKQHPGLYYADVNLDQEGAYIIHAAAFYKGYLSHDSRVLTVSASSIGTVQDSVDELSQEINHLQTTLEDTQSSLNETKSTITGSVEEARGTIREEISLMRDASGQINSLILPVLALISVIIALQISLFARIRASYR